MVIKDSYASCFDEDVPNKTTNKCPECDGLVTMNVVVTSGDDCRVVIDDQRTTHGPAFP